MGVFSIQRRSDTATPRPREPQYEYLDRSARTEAIAIRRLIRRWLKRYPAGHRRAWCSSFASGDDGHYYAAFWELYLFNYFSRLGFEIEVAPNSQGGKVKAPDFRMRHGDLAFYLEATTAHDLSGDESRIRRWKADVRGAIDAIKSTDFFVSLDWEQDPNVQPASAAPASEVANWLATLDYAQVHTAFYQREAGVPVFRVRAGGGVLRVSPVPKNQRRYSKGLIGTESLGLRQANVLKALRTSVRAKSSRYGELDLPYIVAVNVLAATAGPDEFVDALFGTPEVVVTGNGQHYMRHGVDGAFGTGEHPRAQRVSAVLFVRDLSPWSIGQESGQRILRLINHPWSSRPLPKEALGISEYLQGDGFSDGDNARQRLGLVVGWPEQLTPAEHRITRTLQLLNRFIAL